MVYFECESSEEWAAMQSQNLSANCSIGNNWTQDADTTFVKQYKIQLYKCKDIANGKTLSINWLYLYNFYYENNKKLSFASAIFGDNYLKNEYFFVHENWF